MGEVTGDGIRLYLDYVGADRYPSDQRYRPGPVATPSSPSEEW